MFKNLGDRLRRFMYGRYGSDQLNLVLLVAALVLLVVSRFTWAPLSALSLLLLGWSIFRTYSKNIPARQRENAWLLRLFKPLTDRQHRYFRCPKCRQTVRVPRGKGKIAIRCPKCGEKFTKNA